MNGPVKIPTERELADIIERARFETNVPGIGVVVSIRGQRIAAFCGTAVLGEDRPLSEASRFEMSCLMKLFLSLTTLELAVEGRLDLDGAIQEYLPELRTKETLGPRIRVRHLLNHTSGYRGLDISDSQTRWNYSWDRFVHHFLQADQSFPAGCVFNYEHADHVILGEIVSRACQKSASDVVKTMLLDRLSIVPGRAALDRQQTSSYVAQHTFSVQQGRFVPMALPPFGRFWESSLPDATISLPEIVAVGETLVAKHWERSPISDSTRALLQEPGVTLPSQVGSGIRSEDLPISFGWGCAQYRNGMIGHNGSMFGQTCALRVDPLRGLVIAVGTNAWVPHARDSSVERVAMLLSGVVGGSNNHPADVLPFRLQQVTNGFSTADLAGRYRGSYASEVQVSPDGQGLRLDIGTGAKRQRVSIVPERQGRYIFASPLPVSLAFFADPVDRSVPALMLGMHAYKRGGTS